MRDYCWSKLFLVFISSDANKTLGEMTFNEYQEWRNQRDKDSFATKFADWISHR